MIDNVLEEPFDLDIGKVISQELDQIFRQEHQRHWLELLLLAQHVEIIHESVLVKKLLGLGMVLDQALHNPQDQHVDVEILASLHIGLLELDVIMGHVSEELVDCRNLADGIFDEVLVEGNAF